jgi:hypothetical protein
MIIEYKRFREGETVRLFRFTIGQAAYESRRRKVKEILERKYLSVDSSYRSGKFVYIPDFVDAAIFFKEIK